MNIEIKERFMQEWEKYFPGRELPIVCYYSDELGDVEFPNRPKENRKGYTCIFSQIAPVRRGRSRAFNMDNLGCFGSFIPLGFVTSVSDDVKNYICNIERVKKSYKHVDGLYEHHSSEGASGKYLIFKRWDSLEEQDEPQVVFFLANADVISGLHTLANFDSMTAHGVVSPAGSGCDSIVGHPMSELNSDDPKAILGALDPSVRACVRPDIFTFSAPWNKFVAMLDNMEESFLNANCWTNVKSRFK